MTAIIAIKDENGFHLCSDTYSKGNYGYSICTKKIYDIGGGYLIGISGPLSISLVVSKLDISKLDVEKNILDIGKNIKELIMPVVCAQSFSFILTNGDEIIRVDDDMIIEPYDIGTFIGSGGDIAFVTYKVLCKYNKQDTTETLVKLAVKETIDMNTYCGGDVDYYFIKKPDGK